VLLGFYNYPAEHWIHLRITNPIESTFATVQLRQRVTKGPGSRAAGIAMAFKLIESAQALTSQLINYAGTPVSKGFRADAIT
jgi:putative transposase